MKVNLSTKEINFLGKALDVMATEMAIASEDGEFCIYTKEEFNLCHSLLKKMREYL
tara:strand:- start:396 stop:563 length:168 start_codon:yes stop_codon:yes gene_type:complete